jgi:predicted lactoylglutathione lyase
MKEMEAEYERIKNECGGTMTKDLQDKHDMYVKKLQDLHADHIELLRKGIIEGKWDD